MGCVNSSERKEGYKKDNKALTQYNQSDLSDKEKQIIRETWSYMTEDLSESGLQIFLRIFELSPDVQRLFSVEDIRHSELSKNTSIRAHGQRFILAIEASVNCLNSNETDKEELNKTLVDLGKQHKQFVGFLPEYFEIFYEALMWRWEACMADMFTKEVSDTWSHVFFYMMDKMREGYTST